MSLKIADLVKLRLFYTQFFVALIARKQGLNCFQLNWGELVCLSDTLSPIHLVVFSWCLEKCSKHSEKIVKAKISNFDKLLTCCRNTITTRVEIPLKNRSRFERFERFTSKIWAVWAVWAIWAVFLEKPLQPLKSCLKTAHFLRWFLNGFSSKNWAVFERFLSGLPGSRSQTPPAPTYLPPPTYSLPPQRTPPPPNVPSQRIQHPTNNPNNVPPPPPTYPPSTYPHPSTYI